jgi:hypothetical protein
MLDVIQIFYDREDDVVRVNLGGPETERSLTFPNPRGRFLPERVARTCLIEGIDRSKLRKWLDRPVRRREPKPLPKTVRIKGACPDAWRGQPKMNLPSHYDSLSYSR